MVPFLLSSKPEKRGGKKTTESTTPQVNESNPAKGTASDILVGAATTAIKFTFRKTQPIT